MKLKISAMLLATLGFSYASASFACLSPASSGDAVEDAKNWAGFPAIYSPQDIAQATEFSRVNYKSSTDFDLAYAQVNLGDLSYLALATIGDGGVFSKCYSIVGAHRLSIVETFDATGTAVTKAVPAGALIPVLDALVALLADSKGKYFIDYTESWIVALTSDTEIQVYLNLQDQSKALTPQLAATFATVKYVKGVYDSYSWQLEGALEVFEPVNHVH